MLTDNYASNMDGVSVHCTQDHLQSYQRQGFIILRGLLDTDTAAQLYQETLDVVAARNLPDSYLAQSNEYLKGSQLDQLNNGAYLREIVSFFMQGESSLYLPFTAVKGPHQGPFDFHQDNNYTRHDGESCNCWIALGACNKENGTLQVVPGSHLQGTVDSEAMFEDGSHRKVSDRPDTWLDVELEPGDAILFSRLCIHGSGANQTDEARVAYAVQFHRNDTKWYDPETDSWDLLIDKKRFDIEPVDKFSDVAAAGE